MSKQEAGRRGGKATLAKYGKKHFKDLAARWHAKYKIVPYGTEDWLIVNRATGKPLSKTLNGKRYNPTNK